MNYYEGYSKRLLTYTINQKTRAHTLFVCCHFST